MGKVLFVLELPEPKLRKEHAPPSKRHKDATKYSRKQSIKRGGTRLPTIRALLFFRECAYLRKWPTEILFAAFSGVSSAESDMTHQSFL